MRTARMLSSAFVLLLLLAPPAAAISWSWTGTYLRLSDRTPVYYDDETGGWTITAPVQPLPTCGTINGDPRYERCGECIYTPDAPEAWKSNLTTYQWGRCVNVDLRGSTIEYRSDIRTQDGGAAHTIRGQLEFVKWLPGGNEMVLGTRPIHIPECDARTVNAMPGMPVSLSQCASEAWSDPFPTTWPLTTDDVCLRLESWREEGSNTYAEFPARPCRPVSTLGS